MTEPTRLAHTFRMRPHPVPAGTAKRRRGRTLGVIAVGTLALGLTACGGEEPAPAEPTPATSTESAEPTTTELTTSQAATTPKKDKSKDAEDEENRGELAKARSTFSGLVPAELFDQFDSCTPNGLENSMECSGRDVGQFQFFKSDSKAASTTQVLTELRSSRIVEDKKDRVVGWSTLGNTAVLTVVDNARGLVVQQMVSTDQVDPEDRIFELGLAQPPEGWESSHTGTRSTHRSRSAHTDDVIPYRGDASSTPRAESTS